MPFRPFRALALRRRKSAIEYHRTPYPASRCCYRVVARSQRGIGHAAGAGTLSVAESVWKCL